MVCLLCDFKILLTVFNQSYNCQTSHYLGRNRLPKPFLILPSLGKTVQELHFLLYILCCCNIMKECKSMLLQMAYSKENSKLPCLPRNSQPFMTPLIIRMTLHPLQCKCQVSTIAFQLCCTFGLSSNKTLKIFKVQNSI